MQSEAWKETGELISAEQRRADFPILDRVIDGKKITYLDSAASSLKPRQVVAAIVRYYEENGSNVHRGEHFLSEAASVCYEQGRYEVGEFIGAAGNEIVFVRNTTDGLNIVGNGIQLEKSDVVVTSIDSHHSGYLTWMGSGSLRFIRLDQRGEVDLNHFEELLKLSPKVVALTHCSNVSGAYLDLRKMTRMAREAGAIVVADLAQSISHEAIDVRQLDVDFAAFSAHKMLGPTGIGVLYGRSAELERLKPSCLGGGTVDWVDLHGYRLRKIPHRLEAGTPHIAGVYGLVAAMEYLQRVGSANLAAHEKLLSDALMERALERPYVRVVGPRSPTLRRGAILSFQLQGVGNMGSIARVLSDAYGIMCRSGTMCAQPFVNQVAEGPLLRVSCHLYNTVKEIDYLFAALDEIA